MLNKIFSMYKTWDVCVYIYIYKNPTLHDQLDICLLQRRFLTLIICLYFFIEIKHDKGLFKNLKFLQSSKIGVCKT